MGLGVVVSISAAIAFALLWAVGANDVANALGTSVGSKAITPRQAIVLGAIFECLGSSLMGSHVATTLSNGLVHHDRFASDREFAVGMFAALFGSFLWITIGTYFALPLSSTHTVVGSVIGFALLGAGVDSVRWDWLQGIAASWVLSPLLGGFVAYWLLRFVLAHILLPHDRAQRVKTFTPWLLALTVATNAQFVFIGGPSLTRVQLAWYYNFPFFLALLLVAYVPSRWFMSWWEERCQDRSRRRIAVSDEQVSYQNEDDPPEPDAVGARERGSLDNNDDGGNINDANRDDDGDEEGDGEGNPSAYKHVRYEVQFVPLMVFTACVVSFAHGGNDVANAIGPFFVILEVHLNGEVPQGEGLPLYLPVVGGVAIVMGLTMWGYKVMDTIGNKITKLTFSKGYCAQFGAGLSVLLATFLGLPISTTSVIVGSVMGVGLVDGRESVNFKKIRDIVVGWIITLPIAAVVSMATFAVFRAVFL